jgi:hypothetical protein
VPGVGDVIVDDDGRCFFRRDADNTYRANMPAQPVDRDGLMDRPRCARRCLACPQALTGRASLRSLRQLARPLTRPTGLFLFPRVLFGLDQGKSSANQHAIKSIYRLPRVTVF